MPKNKHYLNIDNTILGNDFDYTLLIFHYLFIFEMNNDYNLRLGIKLIFYYILHFCYLKAQRVKETKQH